MTFHKLRVFLFGTLRGRLVFSVAAIHAVMMTLFIVDLTTRQRSMLLENQTDAAITTSNSLAMSAAEWIASDDLSGLQELVEVQRRYPETSFAILTDENGLILAHTDKSKVGLYLLDLPENPEQAILGRSATLVDVAVPAMLNNKHIGWARVGLSQEMAAKKLTRVTNAGILYALAAIFIGSVIAWNMGTRITRRLYVVQDTMSEVRKGVRSARAIVAGSDEAASIAHEFNSMLNALDERDEAIHQSELKYRLLLQNIHAAVVVHRADTSIMLSNPIAQQLLGIDEDQLLGKKNLDSDWQFLREDGTGMPVEEYPVSRVLATRKPLRDYVTGIRRPNQKGEIWALVNADPVFDFNKGNEILQVIVTFIDITRRKQAEEALKVASAYNRSLIEASLDPLVTISPDGKITDVNQATELATGVTRETLIGDDFSNYFSEPQKAQAGYQTALKEGFIKDYPLTLCHKSGKSIDVVYNATVYKNTSGEIQGVFAAARDITELKRAEDALRKNNILLERIYSSTEFLIAYLDTEFNFIRVNRAYAESDKRDPEYFIGKNHFDLYPDAKNEAIFRKVVESGETFTAYAKSFEYPQSPERGVTYWNWTIQPLKEADGHVSGLIFSLVDVTEREEAIISQREIDARYRTLIEQASDGIFVADPQGNYVDVNPSGCSMLGYTREEILKLNMRDLASAESQKGQPLRFDELQTGKSFIVERTLVTKSGELLPVEISSKMLENGQFLGIVRDITERKWHELEHQAIINVSAALRQVTTRTETLDVILKQLEELFETDGVVLVLPNPQDKGLVDKMGRGPVGERMKGLVIPSGKGLCHWVITNKTPYMNNHAENDPLFYRPDLLGNSKCIAAAPLITQEQAIGALWIARRKALTEHDLHLLTAIADIAASAIHRAILNEQIEQQVRHLLALHEIDIAITANFNLDVTLNIILKHVKDELHVDAASILLVNPLTHALDYRSGMGFKTHNIERSSVKLGEGLAGRAALEYKTASWPDLRLVDEKFSRSSLLTDEEFISYHATPLIIKGQVKGVLEAFNRKSFQIEQDWLDYFETLATQTAIAIENASLLENLQKSNRDLLFAYDATIEGWSNALDLRDKETEGHSQRVTQMALELADKIGMTDIEKADLRRGALLHDIGKMGVPDSILHKPGKLTKDEWGIMRQHPIFAYRMLSPITYLKRALDVCYYHHEKWDGTGYPHGLKSEEIPLSARVFSIVDVFDALTSDRPYRKAWTHEEAYRYIEEQSGKHFDPQIVKIFINGRRN